MLLSIIHTNSVHGVFHWWINKSKYKIQFDTCRFSNKGSKEYLVKNFISFVAYFNQQPQCI